MDLGHSEYEFRVVRQGVDRMLPETAISYRKDIVKSDVFSILEK